MAAWTDNSTFQTTRPETPRMRLVDAVVTRETACQHAAWICLTQSGKQSRAHHLTGMDMLTFGYMGRSIVIRV